MLAFHSEANSYHSESLTVHSEIHHSIEVILALLLEYNHFLHHFNRYTMKTQIQTTRNYWFILVLIAGIQSCGAYKTPVLKHWDELDHNHNGIVHLKTCPVVCQERSVFFEEHVYDAEATTCAYCAQKQVVQMASVK